LERRDGVQTGDLLLQHLHHKFEAIRRYLEAASIDQPAAS
jgi:hypothetical protein